MIVLHAYLIVALCTAIAAFVILVGGAIDDWDEVKPNFAKYVIFGTVMVIIAGLSFPAFIVIGLKRGPNSI